MPDFRDAIRQRSPRRWSATSAWSCIGEDVADAGGVFKVTEGSSSASGPDRVVDTPISELALAGTAFGSAVAGLRPIVEIMFGDFMALPMDSLVNQAAKYWYLSGGAASVPLVVRTAVGAGGRFGAIHSQNPGIWLHGVPGLKVVCPSSPSDARPLLGRRSRTTTRSCSSSTSGSTASRASSRTARCALGRAKSCVRRRSDDRVGDEGRSRCAGGGRGVGRRRRRRQR